MSAMIMDELQAQSFRLLKPPCVEVSQSALHFKGRRTTSHDLIQSLQTLWETVESQDILLDAKLADYVFFPLSHIFRGAKDVPKKALELALLCLRILILRGWRDHLSNEMSKQLIILLCFLVGGNPTKSEVEDSSEEISIAAYEALASIARVSRDLGLGNGNGIRAENIPTLGHAVAVMIDGLSKGLSAKVRLAASGALKTSIESLKDEDALKNFFPGIVSSLTKVLGGRGSQRPPWRLLVVGLDILQYTLQKVFGSKATHPAQNTGPECHGESSNGWIEANGHQVKMALANILPLRHHDRSEVQTALSKLCTSVLASSEKSLDSSFPMLLETLVVLCAGPEKAVGVRDDLIRLLGAHHTLIEVLTLSLRDWISSMPRTMQSNDETKKHRLLEEVAITYSILVTLGTDMELISESLVCNLQASITQILQNSSKQKIQSPPQTSVDMRRNLHLSEGACKSLKFPSILYPEVDNRTTVSVIEQLLTQLRDAIPAESLERNILTSLRASTGNDQLAAMWLSVQLSSQCVSQSLIFDDYLDSDVLQQPTSPSLDEVYCLALAALSRSTFDTDESTWRLQALSLEAVALQSKVQGQHFRPELVEALYPILERLGSKNAALQDHAISCLNIVSNACEYSNSAALIIDNADYLVNTVSLKMNTFEISPQAPQVIVMMVRLCGAPLIPYLDDLVESIFSILACYHGYTKLVESLFTVLNAIVDESSKGSIPLIEDNKDTTTRPKPKKPLTMSELGEYLRFRREKQKNRPLSPPPDSAPDSTHSKSESPSPLSDESDAQNLDTLPAADPPAPKPTKANTIITSITNLVPSHLTSPSPGLRTSLLQLLSTSLPQLSRDTDAFLPIAAQLYPYISTRLYTSNTPAFELIAAANAMTVLCHSAGDFLRSRIYEDWHKLKIVFARTEREMREEVRAQKGRKGGMCWRGWDAVVALVVGIVNNVGINEEEGAEDWLFETVGVYVGGVVMEETMASEKEGKPPKQVVKREMGYVELVSEERKEELEGALEGLNPDYLWLVQERGRVQRGGEPLKKPDGVEGMQLKDIYY